MKLSFAEAVTAKSFSDSVVISNQRFNSMMQIISKLSPFVIFPSVWSIFLHLFYICLQFMIFKTTYMLSQIPSYNLVLFNSIFVIIKQLITDCSILQLKDQKEIQPIIAILDTFSIGITTILELLKISQIFQFSRPIYSYFVIIIPCICQWIVFWSNYISRKFKFSSSIQIYFISLILPIFMIYQKNYDAILFPIIVYFNYSLFISINQVDTLLRRSATARKRAFQSIVPGLVTILLLCPTLFIRSAEFTFDHIFFKSCGALLLLYVILKLLLIQIFDKPVKDIYSLSLMVFWSMCVISNFPENPNMMFYYWLILSVLVTVFLCLDVYVNVYKLCKGLKVSLYTK